LNGQWLRIRASAKGIKFELLRANRVALGAGFVARAFRDFVSVTSTRKGLLVTKNLLTRALVVLGLGLSACSAAYGYAFLKRPEVDPSLAISGLTLLVGTLAVLRIRRRK
jgi:hypothetical protein